MYASVCITSAQIFILEINIIILRLASKYSSCKTHLIKILHGHLKFIFSGNVKIFIHPILCALNGREPFFGALFQRKLVLKQQNGNSLLAVGQTSLCPSPGGNKTTETMFPLKSYG